MLGITFSVKYRAYSDLSTNRKTTFKTRRERFDIPNFEGSNKKSWLPNHVICQNFRTNSYECVYL